MLESRLRGFRAPGPGSRKIPQAWGFCQGEVIQEGRGTGGVGVGFEGFRGFRGLGFRGSGGGGGWVALE